MRFAEGLGCDRNIIVQNDMLSETKKLVEGYFTLVNKDFASGMGALYAYEHQTPDVSKSKISGFVFKY